MSTSVFTLIMLRRSLGYTKRRLVLGENLSAFSILHENLPIQRFTTGLLDVMQGLRCLMKGEWVEMNILISTQTRVQESTLCSSAPPCNADNDPPTIEYALANGY